ncbi:putative cytochrome p450 family protein [Eutypa lata UCREL1]|uniref:Putative cytochrome p450 family protein n=1 Tax=Eutypa lata (strain UCR-EL1) TaxID=1287681 RepID=M7SXY2_EUTLA|nr:putative cytochrome p450 family protein [Eutypa lata UCREL1]
MSPRNSADNNTIQFSMAGVPVYLIAGAHNIQTLFKPSRHIGSEALMQQLIFPKILGMPKDEVARYLARTESTNRLSEIYYGRMLKEFDNQPIGEWVTLSLVNFCRYQMGQSATEALCGLKPFELNPDFLDGFWGFEAAVAPLFRGVPKWWNPKPYRARDRYFTMVERYLDSAFENFDWSKRTETEWDPLFGASVLREIAKWLIDSGFRRRTAAAMVGQIVFAALRDEVQTAIVVNLETGKKSINIQKLISLPLLQSVYVETLRLHMSFNIVREVTEPMTLDGYMIKKGSLIEAPMQIAHTEEAAWGVTDHPASEFWAERHIKYVESKDEEGNVVQKREFTMAGRSSTFFPYGGGLPVCPGRHFAKQEIIITLGLVISKFDLEFVEWTKLDGSPSDRPAQDNEDYAGAEAMPPDRDMKIRWKRVW